MPPIRPGTAFRDTGHVLIPCGMPPIRPEQRSGIQGTLLLIATIGGLVATLWEQVGRTVPLRLRLK